MNWFRSVVEGAGLAKYGVPAILAVIFAVSSAIGLIAASITNIGALGLCLAIGAAGFGFESFSLRARARRRELSTLWPQVLDALHSAAYSGLPISEALIQLAETGPQRLRKPFAGAVAQLDGGASLSVALDHLKRDLGEVHADKVVELIKIVSAAGPAALLESLREQSIGLRRDLALAGELESKQGWVAGTAKMAVAAPWLIVAMLASRPENAIAYNRPGGVAILAIGLLVCIFAYRLIHLFGALPAVPRVFASS